MKIKNTIMDKILIEKNEIDSKNKKTKSKII
jgi:hypothetical protein